MTPTAPDIEKDSGTLPPPPTPPTVVSSGAGEYCSLTPPVCPSPSSEIFSQNSQQGVEENKTQSVQTCNRGYISGQNESDSDKNATGDIKKGGLDETGRDASGVAKSGTSNKKVAHGNSSDEQQKICSCPLHAPVGRLLREWRMYRGLSADQVAQLAGMKRQAINRIESGKSSPTIHTVERIAVAMGLDFTVRFHPRGDVQLHPAPRREFVPVVRRGKRSFCLRHDADSVSRREFNFITLRRAVK
jgi:transcriptional regulator with XRE-family HTH domain